MSSPSHRFYATPGRHTDVARFGLEVTDVADAVAIAQGLLVYDVGVEDLYGVALGPDQAGAVQERDAAAVLDRALAVDPRPLDRPREPGDRVGGRCNASSLLTVALLRSAGIPARSRCGFGTTFVPGFYEDHWVAECWDAERHRWTMVDAQLDAVWQRVMGMDGKVPVVVGPDEFVTAGHAWQAWREGRLDADRCGLSSIGEHGSFWIAGNLRLDLAALNKVEMLPWDVWGLGWEPGEEPDDEVLAAFDSVAELTVAPDERFDELCHRYESDPSLRMDGTVFNALLGEQQQV